LRDWASNGWVHGIVKAAYGEITGQDYEHKIKEASRQLGIEVGED
jgi:hypothetical protein